MAEGRGVGRRIARGFGWMVGGAVAIATVLGVGVAAIVLATPDAWVTDRADRVLARNGLRIAAVGRLERRLFPTPGLTARDLRIELAAARAAAGVLSIAEFDARLDPTAALSGLFRLTDVVVREPVGVWRVGEADAAGQAESLDEDGVASQSAPDFEGALDSEDARDFSAFFDAVTKLDVIDAAFDLASADGAAVARIEGFDAQWVRRGARSGEISAGGRLNGERVSLLATAGAGPGGAVSADGSVAGPGASLAFSGELDPSDPSADGRVSLRLSGDPDETRWLRAALPEALAPLGVVDLEGALRADARSISADLDGRAVFAGRETRVSLRSAPAGDGAADFEFEAMNDLVRAAASGRARVAGAGFGVEASGSVRAADPGALAAWLAPARGDDGDIGEAARVSDLSLAGSVDIGPDGISLSLSGSAQHRGASTTLFALVSADAGWDSGAPIAVDAAMGAVDLYAARLRGVLSLDDGGLRAGPADIEADLAIETDALTDLRIWAGLPAIQSRIYGPARLTGRIFGDTERALLDDGRLLLSSRPGGERATDAALAPEEPEPVAWRETALLGRIVFETDGPRPRLEARIEGGAVDLTPFMPAHDAGAPPSGGEWSEEPLSFAALEWVDADVSASADRVDLGALRLGRTEGRIGLEAGALRLTLNRTTLYGGRFRGAMTLDASTRPAAWALEAQMSGVEIGGLLAAFGVEDAIEGPLEGVVALASSGDAPAEIAAELSGSARASLRRGRLLLIDIAELSAGGPIQFFGGVQPEPGVTPFDAFTGSFAIQNGVARTSDIVFDGPVIRMVADGSIDIRRRRLDMTGTPTGFGRISLIDGVFARAFPVRLAGPWSDPAVVAMEDRAIDDPNVLRGRD